MLDLTLQIPQFLAIAVANFILGWLWYSPVLFMRPWTDALGIKPDPNGMSEAEKARMPYLFAGAIVASLALSFVLQVLVRTLGAETFLQGSLIGLALWAGQILPFGLGTLWEGRKPVVIVINAGNYIVADALFAGVLAVWR
ncbi:MAG: DUF1761 domain-containing protein [Gemmatimonadetes bacterium]|nr:DUF1761 domain-containing protein [Gemmatimonadota bacterium]